MKTRTLEESTYVSRVLYVLLCTLSKNKIFAVTKLITSCITLRAYDILYLVGVVSNYWQSACRHISR